jgi:hypothetical protein
MRQHTSDAIVRMKSARPSNLLHGVWSRLVGSAAIGLLKRIRLPIALLACLGQTAFPQCRQASPPGKVKKNLPRPEGVAIVDVKPPEVSEDLGLTTVKFSSETTIEITACPTVRRDSTCSFSFFRWEKGVLKQIAEPPNVGTGGYFVELTDRTSSADGRRMLLDFNDREVSGLQHLLNNIRTIMTFGMIAPEDVNCEVVHVKDTRTRKSCFEWRDTFPMTYYRGRSAAMSPSGKLVAIKLGNELSLYQLPSVCEGPRVARSEVSTY